MHCHVTVFAHLSSYTVRAIGLGDIRVKGTDSTTFGYNRTLLTEIAGRARVALDVVSRCGSSRPASANIPGNIQDAFKNHLKNEPNCKKTQMIATGKLYAQLLSEDQLPFVLFFNSSKKLKFNNVCTANIDI